jgi:hypothetical protein
VNSSTLGADESVGRVGIWEEEGNAAGAEDDGGAICVGTEKGVEPFGGMSL